MELETVLYRVEGPVAVISLNRTKAMNSLNKQIFADLTTAFNADMILNSPSAGPEYSSNGPSSTSVSASGMSNGMMPRLAG